MLKERQQELDRCAASLVWCVHGLAVVLLQLSFEECVGCIALQVAGGRAELDAGASRARELAEQVGRCQ